MTGSARWSPLLLVHDESPGLGGSVTSLGALVPFLERSGWRVAVAALQPEGWEGEGIRPVLLPRRGESVAGAAYFAREAARGADLVGACGRLRPDLLLANNGPTANLSTHLAGRWLGIPVAQYVRGPFPASALAARVLRSSRAVFTVGAGSTAQATAVEGVAPEQVDEGLDPLRWPGRRRDDAAGWLWASALVAWKGLPMLLDAYASLGECAPPLTACWAGFPAGHPDAEAPPGAVPPGVTLLRAPPELDAIRARCSVYLHTALRPEPFGRSLLEAMAAGLCPIVPDAGTPGMLVRDGENGFVYPAGSRSGLREAMRRAALDPGLCRRLGDQAALDARAFRSDRVFQPVLAALERVRTRKGPVIVPDRNESAA